MPARADTVSEERMISGIGWGRVAARGDGSAYVTDFEGGKVRRVHVASGAAEVIASGLKEPAAIAVDASGVYVSDGPAIRRLAP
jgi:sugar lactone lactonase YvrE